MTDDELRRLLAELRQENAASHEETRRQFESTTDRLIVETRRHFDVTAEGLKHDGQLLAESVAHVRQENAASHEETRRHFDVTTEGLKHDGQLLAESVAHVQEELRRGLADVRDEMRRGFAETQAMIKFSHAELDRRVSALEEDHRALEDTVADLQARVERLEKTH